MVADVTTIVVEPRFIVGEALASLLEKLQYRVSCCVATPADIADAPISGEGCKLAILGAVSAQDGVSDAVHVRSVWPNCKILLILDFASDADLQRLVNSEIDGCIPFDASADTLSKALELIIVQKLRVMITGGARVRVVQGVQRHAGQRLLSGIQAAALPIIIADMPESPAKESSTFLPCVTDDERSKDGASPLRKRNLSERELQILDSLVKGHANKVIARTCAISEATVKVHMKSILRKIQVANRTQAAVWALEQGYCGDEQRIAP